MLERGTKSDPAVQDAHRVQSGFALQPAAHFGDVISDGEITSAGDFDTPHAAQSFDFGCPVPS
jgi:hypothetical protein